MSNQTFLQGICSRLGISTKNNQNDDFYNQTSDLGNSNLDTKNYLDQQTQSILNQNTLFKRFACISALCNVLLIVSVVYLGSLPKKEPYLLVLDKNTGRTIETIQVQKDALPSQMKAIRETTFIRVLEGLFAVSPDIAMQDKLQKDANNYILPNSFAQKFINDSLSKKENDPYILNTKYIVVPKVVSLLPATYEGESPNAYDFEVESKWYDRKGTFLMTEILKGSLLFEEIKAKDDETLRKNPISTYISKIVWQQKINQSSKINKS